MTTAAAQPSDHTETTWRVSAPHVRKAIAFIKRKRGVVNADDLVAWDAANGRRLFDWDDPRAAGEWRLHQARLFMNRFRRVFDGKRVRAFIHIHEDSEADIHASGYVTVEAIAEHPGMRDQVIQDIARRMRMLASELKMWKLTQNEQAVLFAQLAEAMQGRHEKRPAA